MNYILKWRVYRPRLYPYHHLWVGITQRWWEVGFGWILAYPLYYRARWMTRYASLYATWGSS